MSEESEKGVALARALGILREESFQISPDFRAQLLTYTALVRAWNSRVSLVSAGDLAQLEEVHLPDALSLARYVLEGVGSDGLYMDVGSGGGLPAIPLAALLPELPMVLVERSERKIGFLRKVVGALGLGRVELRCGEFPGVVRHLVPGVLTARAVERPERVQSAVAKYLAPGGVFLCQSGSLAGFEEPGFHVEPIEDRWAAAGLRRGTLRQITKL